MFYTITIVHIIITYLFSLAFHKVTNSDKNNKYKFRLVSCMKAKTVVYGAYFALKLWAYRAYTKYIKKQDKRKRENKISYTE